MPDWEQQQLQWVNKATMAMPTMSEMFINYCFNRRHTFDLNFHNNATVGSSTGTNTSENNVK